MVTRSLNKASYITYCCDILGNIVEDRNGMYVFKFEDNVEVKRALEEYNKCVNLQEKLCVDLIRYNRIIFEYKSLVKAYKEEKAENIIFGNKEWKFNWKKKRISK